MTSQSDHCVAVSEKDKATLTNVCKIQNFTVIPNGVDVKYFRPIQKKIKSNQLIWVGGMARKYNSDAIDYFIKKIWPDIKKHVSEVKIDNLEVNDALQELTNEIKRIPEYLKDMERRMEGRM